MAAQYEVMSAPGRDAVAAGAASAGESPTSPVRLAPGWWAALSAVLMVAVLALNVMSTSAVFSSAFASTGHQFVTGSLDLSVSPDPIGLAMSSMMPGDSVTTPVTVTNTGTATLRYAIESTTTENILAGQLSFTIKSGVVSCDNAGFGGSGSTLYGPAALGSTAGVNVVGNPATGAQAGDRPLAGGANEVLCMQVTLPSGTDSSFLGRTMTATFKFHAEQTANNP
jgi:hypothetical protein